LRAPNRIETKPVGRLLAELYTRILDETNTTEGEEKPVEVER